VKNKGQRNSILALKVRDRWDEKVDEVQAEFIAYLSWHFFLGHP